MHLLDPSLPECDMSELLLVWEGASGSDLFIGPHSGSGFAWARKDVVTAWLDALIEIPEYLRTGREKRKSYLVPT